MIAATLVVKIAAQTADFHRAMADSQRAVRGTAQQMEQASSAVTALQTRMRTLSESYRIGRISEGAYAQALRTLRADVAELGTQTELTANSQQRLAGVGGQAARQLNLLSAQARRNKDGFEAVGVAIEGVSMVAVGGIGALSGVMNRLSMMARGNPVLIGILSGLAALAAAWALISNKARDAVQSATDFSRLRLAQVGITGAQTQAQITAEIAGRERQLAATQTQTITEGSAGTGYQTRTLVVPRLQGDRRAAMEEELANLRTIQVLNTRRLGTETATTAELRKQNVELETLEQKLQRIVGKPVVGGRPVPEALPAAAVAAAAEYQKGLLQTAATAALAGAEGAIGQKPSGAAARLRAALTPMIEAAKWGRDQVLDIGSGIANGLTALMQGIGSGFDNMGQLVLGILGGFMQQLGAAMIAIGIAMLHLNTALASWNPFAVIGAGAALVVAGAALGQVAGRGVGGATGGGARGGGSPAFAPAGASRGEGGSRTLVLQGDTLDLRDPRRLDELSQQLEWLTGRRVGVVRQGA